MSVRESRLCDAQDDRGQLCSERADVACAVCCEDRCRGHLGSAEIKVGVELNDSTRSANTILGYTRFPVCRGCVSGLKRLDVTELRDPTTKILAAAITAAALETKE